MKQSRRMSLVEAIANVLVGFAVALLTQIIVFPLFGLNVSLGENFAIGGLFTTTSIGRSFVLRRVFEAIRVHSVQTQTAGSPSPHDDELIARMESRQTRSPDHDEAIAQHRHNGATGSPCIASTRSTDRRWPSSRTFVSTLRRVR
jgi:hypothetical protein